MIVRTGDTTLQLITQRDHAALSRRVMEHWVPLLQEPRRAAILLAIEEHDNGWREPDEAPTVDLESGRVFDFIGAPAEIRQGVWPRGVARLADRPWSAALVAQHALTIYDRYRGDAAWTAFFAAMEARRDSLVATTGLSLDTLMHDYAYVRIGDLISLIFCNEWDEPHEYPPWTFTRDGDTVVVRPDPFEGRRVPLAIQAREVPNRRYASDAELHAALREATRVTLTGTCAGA